MMIPQGLKYVEFFSVLMYCGWINTFVMHLLVSCYRLCLFMAVILSTKTKWRHASIWQWDWI